jgi:hypothetical protein
VIPASTCRHPHTVEQKSVEKSSASMILPAHKSRKARSFRSGENQLGQTNPHASLAGVILELARTQAAKSAERPLCRDRKLGITVE